ncbi:MAG: hypothetical protein IPO19_20665 [Rhodoferax sp.]|nr:hypothetical protein [Rhodoferax sp.]
MLEACANQAIGLQAMALQASPRMLALASHGDQASELPLLWSLCSTLAELGYSVLVLDAMHSETAQCPGLEQLIDGGGADRRVLDPLMPWTIVPAAIGLKRLCQATPAAQPSLRDLTGLSQSCSVVILYASASTLVSLLPHSGVTPLLAVSGGKRALVSAYQALKMLLLSGGLRPSIACMLESIESERQELDLALSRNLQDCAMTFLGYPLESVNLGDDLSDESSASTLRALALRLVENGMPLEQFDRSTAWIKQPSTAYQGGSH